MRRPSAAVHELAGVFPHAGAIAALPAYGLKPLRTRLLRGIERLTPARTLEAPRKKRVLQAIKSPEEFVSLKKIDHVRFHPVQEHANKFNYIPRYYDPEEALSSDAELRGERVGDGDHRYRPGQYIRTQRDARAARRSKEDDKGRMRIWKMAGAAVIVLLFIYILYPKLADVFLRARTAPAQTESAATESAPRNGLDQTGISDVEWQEQPITVVPNDYQE